jgi:hypothetical protein
MMNRRSLLKALGLGAAGSTFLGFKTGLEMKDSLEYKGYRIFWTGWKRNIDMTKLNPDAKTAAETTLYVDDTLAGQWCALKTGFTDKTKWELRTSAEGRPYAHNNLGYGFYASCPGGCGTFKLGGSFDIAPLNDEPKFTLKTPEKALDKAKLAAFKRLIALLDANV